MSQAELERFATAALSEPALAGGLVFGAVVAADGINNLVTGGPAVVNDALRDVASKLHPR